MSMTFNQRLLAAVLSAAVFAPDFALATSPYCANEAVAAATASGLVASNDSAVAISAKAGAAGYYEYRITFRKSAVILTMKLDDCSAQSIDADYTRTPVF